MIFREKLNYQFIGNSNIPWISAERRPAEGALAFTKKRANISWHEAGKIKCINKSFFVCACPYIISIIESDSAFFLKFKHFLHVKFHRLIGKVQVFTGIRFP